MLLDCLQGRSLYHPQHVKNACYWPHLKGAILDHIQLRGCKPSLALLNEDFSCRDLASPGVLNDLGLRGLVQALKQQQLGQGVLRAGTQQVQVEPNSIQVSPKMPDLLG